LSEFKFVSCRGYLCTTLLEGLEIVLHSIDNSGGLGSKIKNFDGCDGYFEGAPPHCIGSIVDQGTGSETTRNRPNLPILALTTGPSGELQLDHLPIATATNPHCASRSRPELARDVEIASSIRSRSITSGASKAVSHLSCPRRTRVRLWHVGLRLFVLRRTRQKSKEEKSAPISGVSRDLLSHVCFGCRIGHLGATSEHQVSS
jgi:hypothetical protein